MEITLQTINDAAIKELYGDHSKVKFYTSKDLLFLTIKSSSVMTQNIINEILAKYNFASNWRFSFVTVVSDDAVVIAKYKGEKQYGMACSDILCAYVMPVREAVSNINKHKTFQYNLVKGLELGQSKSVGNRDILHIRANKDYVVVDISNMYLTHLTNKIVCQILDDFPGKWSFVENRISTYVSPLGNIFRFVAARYATPRTTEVDEFFGVKKI